MKLLTEMQDGCVHSGGCCIDTEDASPLTVARLEHDAACAHALMLAIENRVQRAEDNNHLQEQVTLRGIKRFADELMREWVFDSTPEQAE
jgi:hypothetical protein